MRLRRLAVCGWIALGAIAVACSSFEAAPGPEADAGMDAPIVAIPTDATIEPAPRDAGDEATVDADLDLDATVDATTIDAMQISDAGAFVWAEADPRKLSSLSAPFGLAPSVDSGFTLGVLGQLRFFDATNTARLSTQFAVRAIERLAVDTVGDAYVVGQYNGANAPVFSLHSGGTLALPTYTAASTVAFVAKIDHADGKTVWAWAFGPDPGPDAAETLSIGKAVATRGFELAVGLSFSGAATFPTQNGSSFRLTSLDGVDGVVLSVNAANGEVFWHKKIAGDGDQLVNSIAFDDAGDLVVGGQTNRSAMVDNTVLQNDNAGHAPFILKLLANTSAHAPAFGRTLALAGDAGSTVTPTGAVLDLAAVPPSQLTAGDFVVCGKYRASDVLDGDPKPTQGLNDGFVTRYAGDGTRLWSHVFGGDNDDDCASVAIAPDGDIAIAANHSSGFVAIGGVALKDPAAVAQSSSAVVRLDANGKVRWVRDLVGAENRTTRVAFAANGDIVYGGFFSAPLDLGGGTLSDPDGGAAGLSSFFLARRSR